MKKSRLSFILITMISISFLSTQLSFSFNSTEEESTFSVAKLWHYNTYPRDSPSFYDLNKDGKLEVIISSYDGLIVLNSNGKIVKKNENLRPFFTPTIADLDSDGNIEIIVQTYNSLSALDANLNIIWKYTIEPMYLDIVPIVVDLDNDGYMEIIFLDAVTLVCLDHLGNVIWNHDFGKYANAYSKLTPLNADQDEELELLIGYEGKIYCFEADGSLKWSISGHVKAACAFDFNNDGIDEIIAIDSNDNFIYSLNSLDGSERWKNEDIQLTLYPVCVDINGDNEAEVIALSSPYFYYLDGLTGEIKEFYEADVSFFDSDYYYYDYIPGTPAIGDLDGNGKMDLVFYGSSQTNWAARLFIFTFDGELLETLEEGNFFEPTPALADINANGITELLVMAYDSLYCYTVNTEKSGLNLYYKEQGSVFNTGHWDSDGDFLDKFAEDFYHTEATNNDTDGDGLSDGYEILGARSDPTIVDTDNDGLDDYEEFLFGLNPRLDDLDLDYDNDTLTNYDEIYIYFTNPFSNDTDSDLLLDNDELSVYLTDPLDSDSDDDWLIDGVEVYTYSSNPLSADTDGDGMPDGWEATFSLNLLVNDSADDKDSDLLTNLEEYQYNTNATNMDTDNDGLQDGEEVYTYSTDPALNDTDDDWLIDGDEILIYFTSPTLNDTEADGMPDGWEVSYSLNVPISRHHRLFFSWMVGK
ncbi:MAG: hypothetical protein ACTSQE_06485 [Candidatus Heimdallarchaeaceae archaeon]